MEKIEVGDWVQDLWPTEPEVNGRGLVIWKNEAKGRWGIWWEDPSGITLDGWDPNPDDMRRMLGDGSESLPLVWDQQISLGLVKVDKSRSYDEFKRGDYVCTPNPEHPEGMVLSQRWRLVSVTKGFSNMAWGNYFKVEDLERIKGIDKLFCMLKKYCHDKSYSFFIWRMRRSRGFKKGEEDKAWMAGGSKSRNPFIPFWFWKLILNK